MTNTSTPSHGTDAVSLLRPEVIAGIQRQCPMLTPDTIWTVLMALAQLQAQEKPTDKAAA